MQKRLTMRQLAKGINAHFERFKGDPTINAPMASSVDGSVTKFLDAQAAVAGAYIKIVYVGFQGPSTLTRERAEAYLRWLDAGKTERHHAMSEDDEESEGLAEMRRLVEAGTFKNLTPRGKGAQEAMIHVYWSGLNDAMDRGGGHQVQRGRVTADLGLDEVPVPGFTSEEMQSIAFAAKMQALKCLAARRKEGRKRK